MIRAHDEQSDESGSMCVQVTSDSDNEYAPGASPKVKSARCAMCDDDAAFGNNDKCLRCMQIFIESLAELKVTVNQISGAPALRELPTIRGDMLVSEAKLVFMWGVGKSSPEHVSIVPMAPAGFASAVAPLEDNHRVGSHGDVVMCVAHDATRDSITPAKQ